MIWLFILRFLCRKANILDITQLRAPRQNAFTSKPDRWAANTGRGTVPGLLSVPKGFWRGSRCAVL